MSRSQEPLNIEKHKEETNNFVSSVWDFSSVTKESMYATHSFHIWRGKLVPHLVSRIIDLYSSPGETVLDNFCGSGTTLVESKIKSRNCIGVDISPLACLISNVKSTFIDQQEIMSVLRKIENEFMMVSRQKTLHVFEHQTETIVIPDIPSVEKWFDLEQLKEIIALRDFIKKIEDIDTRDFLIVALSSILKQIAKVDPRSIDHIVSVRTKKRKEVWNTFAEKVHEMLEGMATYKKICEHSKSWARAIVGDARDLSRISRFV